MTKWLREFRIVPVLLIAAGCLLGLKTFGLVFNGGYTLGQRMSRDTMVITTAPPSVMQDVRSPATPVDVASGQSSAPKSWAQEMFNYPADVTGSVHGAPKEPPKEAEKKPGPMEPPPDKSGGGTAIPIDQSPKPTSAAERALLERLQERRKELDARAREIDLRESLLKAAETKLEGERAGLKEGEGRVGGSSGQRQDASDAARMKALVTMYETMKPKEAAKIFDRLDIRVLLDMASQIKPQLMSAILAQMSAESAERLTMELASKIGSDKGLNPSTLPKIDGKPDGN